MLTHGHPRSMLACGIYVLIALQLLEGRKIPEAIKEGVKRARNLRDITDKIKLCVVLSVISYKIKA